MAGPGNGWLRWPVIETEDGTLLADPQVCAELVAFGDEDFPFDPSIVTDALGLSPTSSRRVGDQLPRNRSSRHAWWALRVFPKQVAFLADDVVNAALAPLTGKEEVIAGLRRRGVRFQLAVSVEMHASCDSDGDPTVHDMYLGLGGDTVARLAAFHMAYDIEQQFVA